MSVQPDHPDVERSAMVALAIHEGGWCEGVSDEELYMACSEELADSGYVERRPGEVGYRLTADGVRRLRTLPAESRARALAVERLLSCEQCGEALARIEATRAVEEVLE